MRKPKIKEMKQTDGSTPGPSLDEIFGASSPYKTNDPEIYRAELNEMNLSELQIYALEHDVVPKDDRFALIDRLMGEFRRNTGLSRIDAANAALREKKPVKLDREMQAFLS